MIETLCYSRHISVTTLCKESGAPRGSLGDLKKGRIATLSNDTLKKIADYFNVSIDALLGRDTLNDLPDTITLIARAGRKLTPEQQDTLLKFAQFSFPEAFEDE